MAVGTKRYYVYILTNKSQTLYIGITNDLDRRLAEHRDGVGSTFTSKYRCHTLVWFETFSDVRSAIAAEKKYKGWTRAKKIALIEATNPSWRDLSLPDIILREPRRLKDPAALGRESTLGSRQILQSLMLLQDDNC